MILRSPYFCSFNPSIAHHSYRKTSTTIESTASKNVGICCETPNDYKESKIRTKGVIPSSLCTSGFCSCVTRRRLMGTAFLPVGPLFASGSPPNDPMKQDALNKFHPPRPDWYEELYAFTLKNCMKAYNAEIERYKLQLFDKLRGKANKILEFGIGTGPNLKYYATEPGVHVFGIDPMSKMEKYAREAAVGAGLPPSNFSFMQSVAEALPLDDASVDAVVGTLVLCSVKDVDITLQEIMRVLKPGGLYLFVEHVAADDGTIRRFVQGILDPLQQFVADGCHLTRKTGEIIAKAGFSTVQMQKAFISTASILNPHVYGVAYK